MRFAPGMIFMRAVAVGMIFCLLADPALAHFFEGTHPPISHALSIEARSDANAIVARSLFSLRRRRDDLPRRKIIRRLREYVRPLPKWTIENIVFGLFAGGLIGGVLWDLIRPQDASVVLNLGLFSMYATCGVLLLS